MDSLQAENSPRGGHAAESRRSGSVRGTDAAEDPPDRLCQLSPLGQQVDGELAHAVKDICTSLCGCTTCMFCAGGRCG